MYETDLGPIPSITGDLRAVRIENVGDESSGGRGEDGGGRRPKQKRAHSKGSFAQVASEVGKVSGPHDTGTTARDTQPHEENADKNDTPNNEHPLVNDRRHIDVKA